MATHVWLAVNQRVQIGKVSPAAKLHPGQDGSDHFFDMCIVLDGGEVESQRSQADQAAEVVRRWGEKEPLLVPRQNVRSRNKEHDCQPEQEAVDSDPADAAQAAPALRRFPFHFQDGKQVHGGVVHLQKLGPFAVIIRHGAQQAVFVVHLCHGVNSLESQVSLLRRREDF